MTDKTAGTSRKNRVAPRCPQMHDSCNRHSNPANAKTTTEPEGHANVKRLGPKPTLCKRQQEELKIAFGEFDPRGSGLVDSRNYLITLRAMGYEPKEEKVQAFIDETIGTRCKETLDFKEFHKLMTITMLGHDSKAELNRMFRAFTNDDQGGITLEKLTAVAKELGEDITKDELEEMISFAGTNHNGWVSFDEFVKIMERPVLE